MKEIARIYTAKPHSQIYVVIVNDANIYCIYVRNIIAQHTIQPIEIKRAMHTEQITLRMDCLFTQCNNSGMGGILHTFYPYEMSSGVCMAVLLGFVAVLTALAKMNDFCFSGLQ